jgi:hypothetical protein
MKTHVNSKACFLQLCKTQEREYMTDGYDIITEISTTYNSEHSEVAQAFWPCKHQNTTSRPSKKQILFVFDGLNVWTT